MALGWMLSVLQRGRAALQAPERALRRGSPPSPARPARAASRPCAARSCCAASPSAIPDRPQRRRRSTTSTSGSRPDAPSRSSGARAAGKSTLVQLLPRLFDVEAGQRDCSTGGTCGRCRSAGCGGTVGLVPQDPFLFSRTIGENVAFASDTDRGEGGVAWAVEAAGLRARPGGHAARARHHRRRARHHAVGRTEAARDTGARPGGGAARAGARRRAVERRRRDRAGDPRRGCAASSASAPPSWWRIASRP